MRRAAGFTLIELMVVVAVIAILAAVAYPSYTRHLAKMHRTQAQSYLLQLAQRQQQYYMDSREYASQDTILALDPVPAQVAEQYVVSVRAGTATAPPSFVASATPRAASMQAAQQEPMLSVAQDGTRTPSYAWQ